ncbi:MAG: hypothetical protein HY353_03530 [Candidatus Omnitrophica bacterium]|nr:hypothetical protein [Candidatus Omnitrophota bacterium]
MSRLDRWLVGCWIALAVWFSDRWAWTLPALIGVLGGVAIARLQRTHHAKRLKGLPPFELGSLLILTGFLYLYVVFLLFHLSRTAGGFSLGLLTGLVLLSLLLLGFAAVFLLKKKVPRWLSRVWKHLIEER